MRGGFNASHGDRNAFLRHWAHGRAIESAAALGRSGRTGQKRLATGIAAGRQRFVRDAFNWTIKLFTVFRIPLELHVSFLIVPLYFANEGWRAFGWLGVYWAVITCAMIFSMVVMHELGHALAARRYGIETQSILLLPFGGIALLESMPDTPRREILVTLAGPAVNFGLALALWPFANQVGIDTGFAISDQQLVNLALLFNLAMGLFNLVPVFPMDGGRLLRAALSYRFGFRSATRFTARAGTILAVAGAGLAWFRWENLHLAALFLFIAYMSRSELRMASRSDGQSD